MFLSVLKWSFFFNQQKMLNMLLTETVYCFTVLGIYKFDYIEVIQFLTWLVSEWHLWVPLKVWSWKAETERSESHWLISRRLTSTSKERNPSNLLEKIRGKYLYIILKPFLLMLKTLLWYSFGYRCYLLKCRKRIDWYLGGSHWHQKKEIPVICCKNQG